MIFFSVLKFDDMIVETGNDFTLECAYYGSFTVNSMSIARDTDADGNWETIATGQYITQINSLV